jgi:hypothetical protein
MLNSFTELDFQDELKKKGRSAGNGAYVWKGAIQR